MKIEVIFFLYILRALDGTFSRHQLSDGVQLPMPITLLDISIDGLPSRKLLNSSLGLDKHFQTLGSHCNSSSEMIFTSNRRDQKSTISAPHNIYLQPQLGVILVIVITFTII